MIYSYLYKFKYNGGFNASKLLCWTDIPVLIYFYYKSSHILLSARNVLWGQYSFLVSARGRIGVLNTKWNKILAYLVHWVAVMVILCPLTSTRRCHTAHTGLLLGLQHVFDCGMYQVTGCFGLEFGCVVRRCHVGKLASLISPIGWYRWLFGFPFLVLVVWCQELFCLVIVSWYVCTCIGSCGFLLFLLSTGISS